MKTFRALILVLFVQLNREASGRGNRPAAGGAPLGQLSGEIVLAGVASPAEVILAPDLDNRQLPVVELEGRNAGCDSDLDVAAAVIEPGTFGLH